MVSRYLPLWRNRCRPVSHGPPPLLYQRVLVKYPYVEPQLAAEVHRHRKIAAAKAEDLERAFAVCCIRCPCSCLHVWVVFHRLYRYNSSVFMWLPLVCFYCLCDFVCVFYLFCPSRRRPLLTTFLSVLFCLLSLLISERISGLIWFDSVYLVTTAGFVADQFM